MSIDMNALARLGAHARLAELAAEMDAIRSAFPDLAGETPQQRGRPDANRAAEPAARAAGHTLPTRGRKTMSAAAKKAVSERMRAYWKARKAASVESDIGQAPDNTSATTAKAPAKRVLSAEGRARISAAAKKRWRALRKGKKAA
jgi:hypothetical protein